MRQTHPYWLAMATPHALVDGGVSVDDELAPALVEVFDRHHRLLGRNEPLVSGWSFLSVKDNTTNFTQACEQAPVWKDGEKFQAAIGAAQSLDARASLDPGGTEAWRLSYVLRDRRTTCAAPRSIRLLASRLDVPQVARFFRQFSSACMEGMEACGDYDVFTCYGWSLTRQMDDPFLAPTEILAQLRAQLLPHLRAVGKLPSEGAWSRMAAIEADIQSLLLQSATGRPAAVASAYRL